MSEYYPYGKITFGKRFTKVMDYLKLLNEKQYEAVSTTAKYVRIVAGAGSGKTRVLTYRISYLVGERNVKPSSIVAIAFTNKVANEMKVRAISLLEGKGRGIQVSTFHSWCAKFLRREIDILGFPNNFTIMDEDDQVTLVKNLAVENGFKRNDPIVKQTLSFIGYCKTIGQYPEDVKINKFANDIEKQILKFYHLYEDRKNEMLSLDFDDLLLKTIQILEEFPDIRRRYQDSISNILVDEFQDTNDVQYKLIKLLMNEDTALYVVGDPDQTIYTWRGANQDIILNFTKDFPLAETIILNRNYRSTKTILGTANKLIAHNKKRVPKDLFTENEQGSEVIAKCLSSREAEAKYVLDQIEQIKLRNPEVKYKDIAILYRAAYLTLPFENEFMKRRIPYQIYGGIKFYQRKEVKDVLAYFRVIYNSKDDISFERIINVPRRGIGDSSIDILKMEKEQAGLSYYDYIKNIQNYSTLLKSKVIVSLSFLIEKIEKVKQKLEEGLEAYPKILEDFITEINYFEYLANDDDADERLGNVKTLFDNIIDFLKLNPESSFEQYLQDAALQSSQDEINDSDHVNLMTIHVAKGLEFDYVFVVSLINGIFPSERTVFESNGDDGMEEERRLCYVAFTRARKALYATCNTSYSFVLEDKSKQSPFFEEAGLSTRDSYGDRYKINKPIWQSSTSLFDDIRPSFDAPPKKEEPVEPTTNGITDWEVGDIVRHDKFGTGVVTQVIDETIIEVNFEQVGVKTLMANHKMIHREAKKGADA